jgi:hypothetical protein
VSEDPAVALVFPPLVESSFGGYYPSTAVLAGWLYANGVSCTQIDLNADFAEYLLASGALLDLATGRIPGIGPDELPAACSRWAVKNHEELISESGVFQFGPTTPLGYVMEELARPFVLNPNQDVLFGTEEAHNSPWALQWHRQFMDTRDWSDLLPASVQLIGISVPMGPQILPAVIMARAVRQAGFSARIVLGGPAVSLMDDKDLERLIRTHPAIDAVVRFDGEDPVLSLTLQISNGDWSPASVSGCSFIDADDGFLVVPPLAGLALGKLPAPVYDAHILQRIAAPTFSVTQARGCYWGKCDYCDFVELYDGSPPYRGRQPAAVVDEMSELNARYGATRFTLVTESIPPAFARRMSNLLLERGLDFEWDSFAMADRRFDAELLQLMARAGCTVLVIGMETMTTRVLRLVHKSADREENIRFLQEARQAGMKLSINLIPDLPSTRYEEAVEALDTVQRYRDCIDSVSIFPFETTRSSQVGRTPEVFGLARATAPSANGQAQYTLNNAGYVDPAMTYEERAKVHALYRAFARELNRERMVGAATITAVGLESLPTPDPRLRMAVETFDWHLSPERVVVTNIVNREVIRISRRVDEIVRPFLSGETFLASEFTERSGIGDRAERLLENLLNAQLAIPVAGSAS